MLNALCGRAYYGQVTGKVFVNGNIGGIEDHKDSVGFVPQVGVQDCLRKSDLIYAIDKHFTHHYTVVVS